MSTYFGVSAHRIIYKAASFATGKTVTAYVWNPSLTKSALQTFTEVSDGLYYLDYTFAVAGTHFGVFYEDAVAMTSGAFRIQGTVDDILTDTNLLVAFIRNKKYLAKDGTTWYLHVRNVADDDDILKKELQDKDGADITDVAAGVLAKELASSV